MTKSNKIVDLQKCEDGTYSPKGTLNISKISKLKGIKSIAKKEEKYNKHHVYTEADEFLVGLDAGLNFVEAMKSRALRIMGLRD